MKLITKFLRSSVPAGNQTTLDLMVKLCAPAPQKSSGRPPLCLLPVVDVSGSMSGAKLDAVRRALEKLAAHVVPGDVLGLVAFDAEVHTLMAPVEVTEARRLDFLRRVQELRAGSSTNLGGGLLEGLRLVGAIRATDAVRTRVVLLTDGLANEGPARSAEELVALVNERGSRVGVSAFGYGDDCDQMLLGEVAEAGGGSYAYIRDEDAVLTAFGREMGGLLGTYGSRIRVRVRLADGSAIEEKAPDLLHHNQAPVLFQVAVPAGSAGTEVELGTVEVSWDDARGRPQEARTALRIRYAQPGQEAMEDEPEVRRLGEERLLRRAQEQAEKYAARQDFKRARRVLKEILGEIRDPGLGRFVVESLLPCYAEADAFTSGSGVRSSSRAALTRNRQVMPASEVAACFDLFANAAEAKVVRTFTSSKPPRTGKKKPVAPKS